MFENGDDNNCKDDVGDNTNDVCTFDDDDGDNDVDSSVDDSYTVDHFDGDYVSR